MPEHVTWAAVVYAAIVTLPAIISAFYARGIKRDIKTPSGGTIGARMESTHENTVAAGHLLQEIVKNGGAKNHADGEADRA